ncbi:MAG: methyltransferase domain-containing protein [Planctomycetota bacterium]|nr:methyltransferase domain-containing protein [Planctomycetota bacterium]
MTLEPADWSARYQAGNTPWDHGAPHPELMRLIEEGALAPPSPSAAALVPGCGRGHDALALARAGWRVTAIDFVPEVAGLAAELEATGSRYLAEDALSHTPARPYDLLWEHTFFCAIDPSLRPRYGELARRVVAPNGKLAALIFPVGKPEPTGGPPFGYGRSEFESALGDAFTLVTHGAATRSIPARSWREEHALFARR